MGKPKVTETTILLVVQSEDGARYKIDEDGNFDVGYDTEEDRHTAGPVDVCEVKRACELWLKLYGGSDGEE